MKYNKVSNVKQNKLEIKKIQDFQDYIYNDI